MANSAMEETSEMFAQRMENVIGNIALSSGILLGHRLGLFKVMAEFTEPKTSAEIASKAGLNERYVREWLAIMVTSKVFSMSKDDDTYFLPRNKAGFFSDTLSSVCINWFLVMFPEVTPQLEDCFRKGGGIPYSSYKGFHESMNKISGQSHHNNLLQRHIPSIQGLAEKLEAGIKYLDVGCGLGSPCLIMAEKYPKSEFYGFDFEEKAISTAKKQAEEKGLKNVFFKVKDCAVLDSDYSETFDYITAFDSIHDQAYPADSLSAIFCMLKPGGMFSMVDVDAHSHPVDNIDQPMSTVKYSISLFHCMPVSLFFKNGAGLGTCWGKELATKMLNDAGFKEVEVREYFGDFNVHYICKKMFSDSL